MFIVWICVSLLLIAIAGCFVAYPVWKNRTFFLSIALVGVIFLSSFLLYGRLGAPSETLDWLTSGQQHYELKKQFVALGTVDQIIIRMKEIAQTHPDDPKPWHLLGRLYESQNESALAKEAFEKSKKLEQMKIDHS